MSPPSPPHPPLLPPAVLQSEELLLRSPEERLRLLDRVFLRFDRLVSEYPGALKIETIGGVYLVAANSAYILTHRGHIDIL